MSLLRGFRSFRLCHTRNVERFACVSPAVDGRPALASFSAGRSGTPGLSLKKAKQPLSPPCNFKTRPDPWPCTLEQAPRPPAAEEGPHPSPTRTRETTHLNTAGAPPSRLERSFRTATTAWLCPEVPRVRRTSTSQRKPKRTNYRKSPRTFSRAVFGTDVTSNFYRIQMSPASMSEEWKPKEH